jgi:hypothetical protein
MKTRIRNEMLLTLETGAATELQQSSSGAATAATELTLKHNYLYLHNKHTTIHKHIYIYIPSRSTVNEGVLCMSACHVINHRKTHVMCRVQAIFALALVLIWIALSGGSRSSSSRSRGQVGAPQCHCERGSAMYVRMSCEKHRKTHVMVR